MDRNHHSDLCVDNACSEPSLSGMAALMHPDDVMRNLQLTRAQKREILASWASDARAVHDLPALRQLDNGAIVRVDDVLRALSALDDDDVRLGQHASAWVRPLVQRHRRRAVSWPKMALGRRSGDDDDDDPPPCPAIIAEWPRSPLSGGETVDPVLAMAA